MELGGKKKIIKTKLVIFSKKGKKDQVTKIRTFMDLNLKKRLLGKKATICKACYNKNFENIKYTNN